MVKRKIGGREVAKVFRTQGPGQSRGHVPKNLRLSPPMLDSVSGAFRRIKVSK